MRRETKWIRGRAEAIHPAFNKSITVRLVILSPLSFLHPSFHYHPVSSVHTSFHPSIPSSVPPSVLPSILLPPLPMHHSIHCSSFPPLRHPSCLLSIHPSILQSFLPSFHPTILPSLPWKKRPQAGKWVSEGGNSRVSRPLSSPYLWKREINGQ